MFEKEAEEYADWFWGASPSEQRTIKQAYQKGAEFGYNKAKEELEEENAELRNIAEFQQSSNMSRYFENKKYVGQLTKAKELIGELISSLSVVGECEEEECELLNRAEQFLKENT